MSNPKVRNLKAEAEQLGLTYVHIPVIPNNIMPNQIDAFTIGLQFSRQNQY
jgi:protein tyrosine phosphatase (PTP) superfamily phosphohydrolase (DUF442 family)